MSFLNHRENNWLRFKEPNSEDLHILEVNEFLPHIGAWINVGGGVLISTFVAAIFLASVLRYHVTVKVPANIRPVGELKLVESAINGTVKKIAVKENQLVNKGDVIVYLDDTQLQSQKKQLEKSLQQSKLQLTQVDAQIREIRTQINAQTDFNRRTVTAAKAELTGNQRNYQDAKTKANADMIQAQISLKLAQDQLARLQQEKLLTATVQEAETALQLAKLQRDRLQNISTSGAIARSLIEEKIQNVKSAQAKLEQAKSNAKNLLEEKIQAVKLAEINLEKARISINPTNSNVIAASARINQEIARGNTTLAALNKDAETLIQQRLELQKQIIRNIQELQQTENELKKTIIISPSTGTITQLKLRNSGQVLQASQTLAQIVPINANLIIKAHVSVKDIDKIKPGQTVKMQVSACPYPDYGILKGKVKTVAADAISVTQNNYQSNSIIPTQATYEVNIEPSSIYLGKGEHTCYLKSGMEGRADIISRQETILQFILRKAKLIANL